MDKVLELFLKYIRDKGISQKKVADDLACNYKHFNEVCRGNKPLSKALKIKLIGWILKEKVPIERALKSKITHFKNECELFKWANGVLEKSKKNKL